MTFIPEKHLRGRNLIAQFVLSHRSQGFCLSYGEYHYIDKWLDLCQSEDQLLLLLADLVPKFYQDRSDWAHPPSLKLLDERICRILLAKFKRRVEL